MPRSKRGGSRQGRPGVTYANRSDLNEKPRQPVQAPTAQQYGDRARNEEAQRIAPLPGTPKVSPPSARAAGGPPVSLTPLDAPTMRPGEPITAGLPLGEGPGPSAMSVGLSPLDKLKRIYRLTGNPDILNLILLSEDQ